MSAHTPELGMPLPWVQDGRGVEDAKGDLVAMVNIAMPALDAQRIARLIAAAPELLDALRKVCDCIVQLEGIRIEYPLAMKMSRALREGKDALAKAEGR